ncbi:MAG: metal ABC transporter ATP-binding protein [Candidatus Woesearchaeota archaeon]
MIKISHVFFSYVPGIKVLSGLTLSIKEGEFVALLGANGSGKTTLMKLILGKLKPTKGTITIAGEKTTEKKSWSNIGYVPQKLAIDHHHPATVEELVQNKHICSHLSIESLLPKQFRALSGGQQQRVLVALALQHDPQILLLDEPTAGMDQKSREGFYKLLKHLQEKHGKTIILITHDNDIVHTYAHKVYCIGHEHHFSEVPCAHD